MSVKKRDNLSISGWIRRFSHLVKVGGSVLDLAAGSGRHAAWLLDRGHHITAVDRRTDDLEQLKTAYDITAQSGDADPCSGSAAPRRGPAAVRSRFEIVEADLEGGSPWPLSNRRFDAVVVVNYLHRPLFPALLAALKPGGVLLYDTFAVGQEAFGRPSRPDFLLEPGELLDAVRGRLLVVAFEHGQIEGPHGPAVKQRIAAISGQGPAALMGA